MKKCPFAVFIFAVGNMMSLLPLFLFMPAVIGTPKLCRTDNNCDRMGDTCAKASNFSCLCVPREAYLNPCTKNSTQKRTEATLDDHVELLMEEVNGPTVRTSLAALVSQAASVMSDIVKEHSKEASTQAITVLGLSLAVFLGLLILIGLCCFACCIAIGALLYYAKYCDSPR